MNINSPFFVVLLILAAVLVAFFIKRFGLRYFLFGPRSLTISELVSLMDKQSSWTVTDITLPGYAHIGKDCNVQILGDGGLSILYHKSIYGSGENAETINVCPPHGFAGSILSFYDGDLVGLEKVGGPNFKATSLTREHRTQSQDLLASVRAIYSKNTS